MVYPELVRLITMQSRVKIALRTLIQPPGLLYIRWLNFKLMHKIDNVGFSLLGRIPGITAKSWYLCKEIINRCIVLFPVSYDCCPKVPCIVFSEHMPRSKAVQSVMKSVIGLRDLPRPLPIFPCDRDCLQFWTD
ncbi:hypothetical protein V1524DRAFT_131683 [Lipomyces starkeyi]